MGPWGVSDWWSGSGSVSASLGSRGAGAVEAIMLERSAASSRRSKTGVKLSQV